MLRRISSAQGDNKTTRLGAGCPCKGALRTTKVVYIQRLRLAKESGRRESSKIIKDAFHACMILIAFGRLQAVHTRGLD